MTNVPATTSVWSGINSDTMVKLRKSRDPPGVIQCFNSCILDLSWLHSDCVAHDERKASVNLDPDREEGLKLCCQLSVSREQGYEGS
jgi:hypothetical protein